MKFPGIGSFVVGLIVVAGVGFMPQLIRLVYHDVSPGVATMLADSAPPPEPAEKKKDKPAPAEEKDDKTDEKKPDERNRREFLLAQATMVTTEPVSEIAGGSQNAQSNQNQPDLSSREVAKTIEPAPVIAQTESVEPVKAMAPRELDLADRLPEQEKQTFLSLLKQGERLQQLRATTPGYVATIPVDMIDRLIDAGIFRSAVTMVGNRLFVFSEGGLSNARKPILAARDDLLGFSGRVIVLSRSHHHSLVSQVEKLFGAKASELTPCLLVRQQLDLVVLATQQNAVRQHGLSLDDVLSTNGRFEYAAGIPFVYTIMEIITKDGRSLAASDYKPATNPDTLTENNIRIARKI